MPTVKVPLFTETYRNVDGDVLTDKAYVLKNGYIDELGGINVRPGMRINGTFNWRIDGLFYWNNQQKLVTVSRGIVELAEVNPTSITSFSSSTSTLNVGTKTTFCADDTYCFLANGARINYLNSVGGCNVIVDGDAPTTVTHVAYLDSYILANNSNNKFYWADVASPLSWNGLSFASGAGNPDNIVALHVVDRRIYLLGSYSTEIWENDGLTPFSRVPGGYLEVGCIAPYSVVNVESSLIWLDHNRYFVEFSGLRAQRISSPYDRVLASLNSIESCVADRIDINGRTYCLFHFPDSNLTLVYDYYQKQWAEWGEWNSASMSWLPFDFNCYTYAKVEGQRIVGGDRSNNLYLMDADLRTENSVPIKFLRQTGHIDYGTSKRKRSNEIRIRIKKGSDSATGSEKLMIRWRDDGSSEWSNIIEIDLADVGETEFVHSLYRTGIYRTRQYEISATDNVPIVMAEAEEDIEVLR